MDIKIHTIVDEQGLKDIFVPYFLELLGEHAELFPSLFRRFKSLEEFQEHFLDFGSSDDMARIKNHLDIFLCFKNGDEVLGCAYVQDKVRKNEFAFADSRQLLITCFVMDPKYRSQGLGKECFALLKKWSVEKGFSRMEVSVSHSNTAAIKLYEDMGFEKEMMYMSCDLSK